MYINPLQSPGGIPLAHDIGCYRMLLSAERRRARRADAWSGDRESGPYAYYFTPRME